MMIELNKNDIQNLIQYLKDVDKDFGILLSEKVDLELYAIKLLNNGHVIAILNDVKSIIGINCFYSNDQVNKTAYLPILSVKSEARGKGCAKQMISKMIDMCKKNGMKTISCNSINPIAVSLYKSFGFKEFRTERYNNFEKIYLSLSLN